MFTDVVAMNFRRVETRVANVRSRSDDRVASRLVALRAIRVGITAWVTSASGTGAHKVKVTGERANGHRTLQMGPWVEGRLLLFDLGYFRYQRFDAIDRNGGSFITRLAANADPCIVATHRQWRARSIELEGKRLKEVAGRLKQDVLDVEVEVAFGHDSMQVHALTDHGCAP